MSQIAKVLRKNLISKHEIKRRRNKFEEFLNLGQVGQCNNFRETKKLTLFTVIKLYKCVCRCWTQ